MTSIAAPICAGCVHLFGDLRDPKCAAFPAGIPTEILLSRVDHRQPYPGDLGITFKPRTPADERYAEFLLAPVHAGG